MGSLPACTVKATPYHSTHQPTPTPSTVSDPGITADRVCAPGRTRTCNLRISIPHQVSLTATYYVGCGLDHLFTVSGAPRMVSTDPGPTRFPRGCRGKFFPYGFPRYSSVHHMCSSQMGIDKLMLAVCQSSTCGLLF